MLLANKNNIKKRNGEEQCALMYNLCLITGFLLFCSKTIGVSWEKYTFAGAIKFFLIW